jgi:hypothetical protein
MSNPQETSLPPLPPLPLTIRGRSPFDGIRFRWDGLADVAFGAAAMVANRTNPPGLVLGILLTLLGLATWLLTSFGQTPWQLLSTPAKIIAGTGSIIGFVLIRVFFFVFFLVIWAIRLFT